MHIELGMSSSGSLHMVLIQIHAMQDAPEVEVEYVSAPHEYEELLQSEPDAAPEATADLGSSEGGLGFVAAGTSGAGSGTFSPRASPGLS